MLAAVLAARAEKLRRVGGVPRNAEVAWLDGHAGLRLLPHGKVPTTTRPIGLSNRARRVDEGGARRERPPCPRSLQLMVAFPRLPPYQNPLLAPLPSPSSGYCSGDADHPSSLASFRASC